MENRFYIKELDSYQKASDLSKERMGTNPNYDLELLPTKQMQEEMWEFLQYRGKNLVAEKFYTERRFYHHLCRMLKEKNNRPESFLDWDKEKWMQQMKIWLLQQGLSLTAPFKNKCGGRGTQRARTLEEVGKEFNVTRERIRQIEAKALRKLRHPSRSRKLKDYLD